MALFRVERSAVLSAPEAWRRLTRWELHAAPVPLTRITVIGPGATGVGVRFVAHTGLGPVGFDDLMEVTRWEPPRPGHSGMCRLEKRGRVVRGWAEIEVHPAAPGCRVVWREELRIIWLPRIFDALAAGAGRLLFGRVMSHLLRG
ncbi:SRPBCC family protein [Streptomyces sp. NPDC051322]|uniref:SRPBCC family protein n=1 Tax=Streptomyces sp. NPDC051322 TaxID=3154645 RepID=UPI00344B75A9